MHDEQKDRDQDTPLRCGTVMCQKRFQALGAVDHRRPVSWSGTVCRPASIMIMTKGNSFQTLTTISDGITRSMSSRKMTWPVDDAQAASEAPITPKSLW